MDTGIVGSMIHFMSQELIDVQAVGKWRFVLTTDVIERGILPPDRWRAVPQHDGWLVPEKEFIALWGHLQ